MPSLVTAILARQADSTSENNTNAPRILALHGFLTGFALVVVLARMYVRSMILKTVGTDDYLIIASMICGVGVLVCFVGECYWGIGKHDADISTPDLEEILHWEYFHSLIVTLGISLVKLSLAFFLLRLVPGKWYKRFLISAIVFLTIFTIASLGTITFSCIPIAANWNFALAATAKCYSRQTFTNIGLFNSIVNIITDVVFACFPIPIIWTLQVNSRTRISLIGILSLGFFCCAAAIAKTNLQAKFFSTPDTSRDDSYFVWNSIELHVGIIAACLPALRPLFASILQSAKSAITTRRPGYSSASNPRHKYYMHEDGIGMKSMTKRDTVGGKYDVSVTGRSVPGKNSKAVSAEGETEEWKRNDSEENILPIHGTDVLNGGIVKRVDVTIS